MHARTICCFVLILIITVSMAMAQEKKLPQLREYTAEQRWERAQFCLDAVLAAAIGYAKSLNHTADDFSQYCVTAFGSSWGKPDSLSPIQVLRGMRRNFLLYSHMRLEIVDSLQNKVIGRFNRPYVARLFKNNPSFYGMTLDGYEGWWRTFYRRLCDYLHLKYEDKVEAEWVTFTISKK
jgi:hypothetical protein